MTIGIEANRLIHEASPYLLQHANNPVDWYPWGEEAFQKAREEDKPIFLSIGYSTCHWCHVMERESFEKEEVAQRMNEAFINIKVDREERPDIDNVYMSVCQILTGSGGWPLTIIMTPEQKPFFAGTYLPRSSQYGRMGMMELIPKIETTWKEKREDVLKSAQEIGELLNKNEGRKWHNDTLDIDSEKQKSQINKILKRAYQDLEYGFDEKMGGFGGAPKFPTSHRLLYLLRYWKETNNYDALNMVNHTLNHMRMGGIFDQVGFGFHRYSTDERWLLPHFEKMLYDQALMIITFIEAYQATKEEKHKETAQEIIEYVMRDLMDDGGAFYSAEDADSEGEEGKFYVWTEKEIDDVLEEKAEYVKKFFGISEKGNFHDEATGKMTGKNILYLDREDKLLMIDKSKLNALRITLLKAREQRIRPALDDKILVDWNGLMIAALAMAGRVFNKNEYTLQAIKACDFILQGRGDLLMHRYCKGKWDIPGHLDDYAFLIFGLIELYEATFDENYLNEAAKLTNETIELFWDKQSAGFFFTSSQGEKLIVRKKEIYDGAIPSGNSIMLINLLKLTGLMENDEFAQKGNQIINFFFNEIKDHPTGYTQMLCGIYYAYGNSGEITIQGDFQNSNTKHMMHSLFVEYLPHIIIKLEKNQNVTPMATLCFNKACRTPTNNVNDILQQLQ
ncbi:MAG: thioredoxin domain-containing protein [Eubacteriales bacterium]